MTTTVYKLTDPDGYTRRGTTNQTQWEPGWIYSAVGSPYQGLCTDGWLHAYEDLLVGVMLNPIHANIANPRALECRGEIGLRDGALKCGLREMEAVRWVDCPQPTIEQRVRFAIGTAWSHTDANWRKWALGWLSDKDQTGAAARAARAEAARAEARAARAAAAAARAAWAATEAAPQVKKQKMKVIDLPTIAAWAMSDRSIEDLYPAAGEKR